MTESSELLKDLDKKSHELSDSDSDSDEPRKNPVTKGWNRYAAEGYAYVNKDNPGSAKGIAFEDESNEAGKPQSRKERRLCALLIICVLLATGLLIALMVVTLKPTTQATTCESPNCVMVAGNMLSKMDLAADPCDDFYVYACDAAEHDPLIPPSAKKWGVFTMVEKKNMAIVKKLLEKEGSMYKGTNSSAVEKAKLLFHTCMNITARESISTDRLLKVVNDLGSWPLTNDPVSGTWNIQTWDLENTLGLMYGYQSTGLFSVTIGTDDKNSSQQKIVFDQGGTLYVNPEYYTGNNTKLYEDAYIKFFVDITKQMGANETDAAIVGKNIWQLEQALAKAFDKPEERLDPLIYYHMMYLQTLQDTLNSNQIDIYKYINNVLPDDIPMTTDVIVYAVNYIQKLGAILNAADRETLATYMVWHVVVKLVPYMPLNYRIALKELESTITGVQGDAEQWIQCVGSTQETLGFVTGALYVQENFLPEDKDAVESILSEIRSSFIANLPSVSWMDDKTREAAIVKADGILQKIGYPEFIQDPAQIDEYYSKLIVENGSVFDNALHTWQFGSQRTLSKYGKPTDRNVWDMHPDMVNAYYNPPSNQIVFPAGILQNPFYDKTFPKSLIFAGVGMVMGHELSHGFDNQGRLFDVEGNLHNWWSNKSAEGFLDKTQCLVDEYSKFKVVDGVYLNGKTTLGENIADNAGLKTAYNAFKTWSQYTGYIEQSLPGLNMTADQLFFLGFSQIWCSYYTPEFAKMSVVTDVHSYAKYRVIGTLRNRQEFADAYQCSSDSPMNPPDKCTIW